MSYSPYSEPSQTPEPPQPSATKILLLVFGLVGVLGLVMCGGMAGLVWYGMQQIQQEFAKLDGVDWDDAYEDALADAIRDDPQVQQVVGDLEHVREDWQRTDEQTSPEDPFYWYEVEGSRGKAYVRAAISEEYGEWFDTALLELPDGETVPLTLGPVPYDTALSRDLYRQLPEASRLTAETGPLRRIEEDWERTAEETATDDPYYWFKIVGEQGSVAVRAERSADDRGFVSAEMVGPDARRHPLPLD